MAVRVSIMAVRVRINGRRGIDNGGEGIDNDGGKGFLQMAVAASNELPLPAAASEPDVLAATGETALPPIEARRVHKREHPELHTELPALKQRVAGGPAESTQPIQQHAIAYSAPSTSSCRRLRFAILAMLRVRFESAT